MCLCLYFIAEWEGKTLPSPKKKSFSADRKYVPAAIGKDGRRYGKGWFEDAVQTERKKSAPHDRE
jgi:hypothetical protein